MATGTNRHCQTAEQTYVCNIDFCVTTPTLELERERRSLCTLVQSQELCPHKQRLNCSVMSKHRWRIAIAVTRSFLSTQCATLSPVSSGMGGCLRAGKLSHYVTSHPGQLSRPSLRDRLMSTIYSWESKGRYGSFRSQIELVVGVQVKL